MNLTGTQAVVAHDVCGTTMRLQFQADNGMVKTQIYDVENERVHRDINSVSIRDGWTELRQQDYTGQWVIEFRNTGDSIEWRVVDSPFSDDRLDFNTTSV